MNQKLSMVYEGRTPIRAAIVRGIETNERCCLPLDHLGGQLSDLVTDIADEVSVYLDSIEAEARVGRAYLALGAAQFEEARERNLWNSASSGHHGYWEKFLTEADRKAVQDSLREAEQRTRAAEKALAEAVSEADAKTRVAP